MIALALLNVLPLNYLGGIVIAMFIAGLCYAWFNAWRQTDKLIEVESHIQVPNSQENPEKKQEKEVLVQVG